MNIDACLSSKKMDWGTPDELFKCYDEEFHFDLDAAARADNTKCPKFLGPGSELGCDSLALDDWPGSRIWLNPPYGRGLGRWYAKVHEQVTYYGHRLVVMLVPSRTDTKYWHRYVWDKTKAAPHPWVQRVDFLEGRIKFVGAEHGAPFPSAVIVFRPNQLELYNA